MNGPIVSIARELGFEGNSFIEGLVVSIFIAGAFIGSISSASLLDRLGSRLTFQINSIPLILGAIIRYCTFLVLSCTNDYDYNMIGFSNFLIINTYCLQIAITFIWDCSCLAGSHIVNILLYNLWQCTSSLLEWDNWGKISCWPWYRCKYCSCSNIYIRGTCWYRL